MRHEADQRGGSVALDEGPLAVISPHLDDAVLGCGELLAARPGSTVITVLAGRPPPDAPLTEWDAAAGFHSGDDVVGARRAEDRQALALLGARPVWLEFLDSQYQRPPDLDELTPAIEQAIESVSPIAVCFPLGLFHSDHLLVARVCLTLAARRPALAWFAYEDALYRALPRRLAVRLAELQRHGVLLEPAVLAAGGPNERKRAAVQAYTSQLRALARPGLPGTADAFAPERYWRVGASRPPTSPAGVGAQFIAPAGPQMQFTSEGSAPEDTGSSPTEGDAPADTRVGVVVLRYNRRDELDATLTRLEELPERPALVVVDNASGDGTTAMVQTRHPQAICVRLKRNIGAAARNVGVRVCNPPYVALCDADTWWAPGSLRLAADLLDAHATLALVTARVLVGATNRVDPACVAMAESPLTAPSGLPGRPLLGFLAGASLVRRSAFLVAGGFEPRFFLGGEEELLAYDLVATGWHLSYVEGLTVHHFPSPARDADTRRQTLARNRVWVAWLRRPLLIAAAETLKLLRRCFREPAAWRAFAAMLYGLPWALRHRRPLPAEIEHGIRQLERAGNR